MGKGKRADIYLEVKKRRGHIFFEWNKCLWLGGQEINRVQSIKQLGITYQENGKINIEERLRIGRRTIYALLVPGLHARSGMSPVILLKFWNTYAVPRYLYGLEIQAYTSLDTKKLEQLQRATCRQFQCLPERTAAVTIYILIGAEPIETMLDKMQWSCLPP